MLTPQMLIQKNLEEGLQARQDFFAASSELVLEAGRKIAISITKGGKLLLCGNGGSAADAQHVAAEFVNRFVLERPPLPALALTTDSSILTSIGNDYSYEEVFSKQVQALGAKGDVLLAISTSGSSPNVLKAIEAAKAKGIYIIGLTGKDGGKMNGMCDLHLNVQARATAHVQEVHLAIEHLICHLVDYFMFENVQELMPFLNAES